MEKSSINILLNFSFYDSQKKVIQICKSITDDRICIFVWTIPLNPRMSTTPNLIETWVSCTQNYTKLDIQLIIKCSETSLALCCCHISIVNGSLSRDSTNLIMVSVCQCWQSKIIACHWIFMSRRLKPDRALPFYLCLLSIDWPLTSMCHYKRKRSDTWQLWKDNVYKCDTWTKCWETDHWLTTISDVVPRCVCN